MRGKKKAAKEKKLVGTLSAVVMRLWVLGDFVTH